jgi:hypothetical protein
MSKKEQMFALVGQWRESGLTRSVFVNQQGLGSQSFDYWCQKQYNEVVKPKSLVKTSPISPSRPPRFVELTSDSEICPKSQLLRMEFELAGGIRIRIY